MKRNSALAAVLMMMMALVMAMGFAPAAAADTCEGYGQKQEVPPTGSGTFDVTYKGVKIGTITWNNAAKTVSWSVEDGYSLDVCVKGGGEGLTTGSGASGTLSPQDNGGGQTAGVSHFAWTVNEVPVVTETETEPVVKETETEPVVDETESEGTVVKETESEDTVVSDEVVESEDGVEVVAAGPDDDVEQVGQVPTGAAATGGGSTRGIEVIGLFAVGLLLIAAAAPVLVVARKASRKA